MKKEAQFMKKILLNDDASYMPQYSNNRLYVTDKAVLVVWTLKTSNSFELTEGAHHPALLEDEIFTLPVASFNPRFREPLKSREKKLKFIDSVNYNSKSFPSILVLKTGKLINIEYLNLINEYLESKIENIESIELFHEPYKYGSIKILANFKKDRFFSNCEIWLMPMKEE